MRSGLVGRGVAGSGMDQRQRHETNIERLFREALEARGLRKGIDFATQYPLRRSFILDFAVPAKKVAIEVDGRKWHSTPEARKRDRFKDHILKRLGWRVFRFREEDVLGKSDECVKTVLETLSKETGGPIHQQSH